MAVELKVPESGESITEVQIGQWRKREGDRVELDEILVDIETDKAAMDLPAPVSGILSKILKKDGEDAAPGDVIAYIEKSDGQKPSVRPEAAGEKPVGAAKRPEPTKEEPQSPKGGEAAERKEAAEQEKAAKAKKSPEQEAAKDKKEPEREKEPRVMPAARRALAEHGLEAGQVEPTGPGGRLLKEDVLRHVEGQAAAEEAEPREPSREGREPDAAARRAPQGLVGEPGREEQIVPMSPMRRVIAKNLVAAQQNAALLTTFNEVDMSEVIALRKQHQEAFREKHGVKLGFMSFFVKAAIEALKLIPQVNAEIRDKSIVYRNYYDIGIAVGGGRGLVVPVLRNAERMSFAEIELKIADLARRAQANQIDLSELKGGTFTISNGGIYGSMLSTPIVNPPQSGILGLHVIQERPVARSGEVVIRPMMYLAFTYDHRIVDGREAVTFLRQIKEVIEQPVRMLIEI